MQGALTGNTGGKGGQACSVEPLTPFKYGARLIWHTQVDAGQVLDHRKAPQDVKIGRGRNSSPTARQQAAKVWEDNPDGVPWNRTSLARTNP